MIHTRHARFADSIRAIPAEEQWRPMPDHEGLYEISSLGRVRSLYFDPPRILKHGKDSNDYPTIMLSKGGKRRPFTVHRLVARAFHPDKQNALHNEVAHLDGDRTNPRADNLKWASKVENHFHMRAHGTHMAGEKIGTAKLTEAQVRQIKASSEAPSKIAPKFGVCVGHVIDIRKGRRWRHVSTPPSIAIAVFVAVYFAGQLLRVAF